VADRLFAAVGFRFDHHSLTGQAFTYRLAPAYIFKATQTKLRASFGTGFKSPSLYQLYAPGTAFGPIGNEGLKPERSTGWDAGVEQTFFGGRARAALTYFHNDFENLIDFSVVQGYINIGRARTRGVEVELSARPGEDLFLSLVYSRLDARNQVESTPLLRRPKDIIAARASYSFLPRWAASVSLDYLGSRKDVDYNVWPALTVSLPSHALLNGVLSYEA
jgi:vitamin B12 transporter